jgi:DNA-directed RNA polymerase subunit RPC12/RpoP
MCYGLADYLYLYTMKNELTIPVQLPDLKEKDIIIAAEHRKKYSLKRDLQAEAFNKAIVTRLEKDKAMLEQKQEEVINPENTKLIRCEKCDLEFLAEIKTKGSVKCPECEQKIKVA